MARKTLKRYFVGFSTQNSAKTGIRTLYDIDLINIDLMTAFQTRVGERVMRPDYGCKLWDYLMEPFTDMMREKIVNEAVRICQLDSRLNLINVQVFEFEHGFRVEIQLEYVPWAVIDTFFVTFRQSDLLYFGDQRTNSNLIGS